MTQLRSVTCYMGSQCYLLPDTSEHTPPYNPSHTVRYSIYLLRRDGRLNWPSWLDSAPAGSRTNDFSTTSPTLNHCTTRTIVMWPMTSRNRMTLVATYRAYYVAYGLLSLSVCLCMQSWWYGDPAYPSNAARYFVISSHWSSLYEREARRLSESLVERASPIPR